ncbi:GNAT family N-acetyltransferase [Sphingomonas parva]|uniref:GNAT family N-acetyltransferase n=1 Tax=Sphingomonas parva TaxID=2555898 RepID=UPI001CDC3F1D|nr:GNAT family N-acetyltransferase [Sphingomonas parva]
MSAAIALPFRVGARTLWRIRRQLQRVSLTLDQARSGTVPALPDACGDGYLIVSLAEASLAPLLADRPGLKPFVRQRYPRFFASLDLGFDAYLAGFSAKSRSTLKRKVRKLAERCGGTLDLRCYRTASEAEEFHRHARAVSAISYQERLLDAGMPDGEAALADLRARAARDAMRGWVLFLDERPISYLYAPAEGTTLVYAFLGYDPAHADLSPGTVLQFEAMRQLMEEGRFRLFDFTEGEGQHKRLFSTGEVACVDLLLLRPTVSNLAVGWSLTGFDRAVAVAKSLARHRTLEGLARRLRR